jgi:hypothetical protein
MTTTFDTAAHPRISDGTFAVKPQTAPEKLDLSRPVSAGLIDEEPTVFDLSEFGGRPIGGVDKIELTYQPDLDAVEVRAGRVVDVVEMRPDGYDQTAWRELLNEKSPAVASYFKERFGAEVDPAGTWDDTVAWVHLPTLADTATADEIHTEAATTDGLSRLESELTWRTIEYDLDVYLQKHVVADEDAITESLIVEEAQVRSQARARAGRDELDDRVAIAGARLISDKLSIHRPGSPAGPIFDKLAKTGAVNVEDFGPTIGGIYTDLTDDDRQLVSMLGTWALSKHREERAARG